MKKGSDAPSYQFLPFALHIDGGFGAIGEAFYGAAQELASTGSELRFANASLPRAYLLRHAAELFLKSSVITLHRGLGVPFGERRHAVLAIRIGESWVPMRRVHSLTPLYAHFHWLLKMHCAALARRTSTDWRTLPSSLADQIAQIDDFDKRSTFLRYPTGRDRQKSDYRRTSVGEIREIARHASTEAGTAKVFVGGGEHADLARVYCRDTSGLQGLLSTLESACDTLSILHFALRCELGGGH